MQKVLVGLSEADAKVWLAAHCHPFEYMDKGMLIRGKDHVAQEILQRCSGRYRALLKSGDGSFKYDDQTRISYSTDVIIFVAEGDRKVFHVDFELIGDGP